MALFTETQLSSITYDVPVGQTAPSNPNAQVQLQLSDGSNVTVFDKLTTALRLMTFMRASSQWQVAANDDITVVSVGATKLLLLENTLINQKLITSFLPIYLGDQVRFVHRSMSTVLILTDALKTVGFCMLSSTPLANNLDMRTNDTNLQLVDWNYESSPADSSSGSLLSDSSPIVYDFTA